VQERVLEQEQEQEQESAPGQVQERVLVQELVLAPACRALVVCEAGAVMGLPSRLRYRLPALSH
jgi:hypothetical protein